MGAKESRAGRFAESAEASHGNQQNQHTTDCKGGTGSKRRLASRISGKFRSSSERRQSKGEPNTNPQGGEEDQHLTDYKGDAGSKRRLASGISKKFRSFSERRQSKGEPNTKPQGDEQDQHPTDCKGGTGSKRRLASRISEKFRSFSERRQSKGEPNTNPQGGEQDQHLTDCKGGAGSKRRLASGISKKFCSSSEQQLSTVEPPLRRTSLGSDSNTEFADEITETKLDTGATDGSQDLGLKNVIDESQDNSDFQVVSANKTTESRTSLGSDSNTEFAHEITETKLDTGATDGSQDLGLENVIDESQDNSDFQVEPANKTTESRTRLGSYSNTESAHEITETKLDTGATDGSQILGLKNVIDEYQYKLDVQVEYANKTTETKLDTEAPDGSQDLGLKKVRDESQDNLDVQMESANKTTETKLDMVAADGSQHLGINKGLEEQGSIPQNLGPLKGIYEQKSSDKQLRYQGRFKSDSDKVFGHNWSDTDEEPTSSNSRSHHLQKDLKNGMQGYVTLKTLEVGAGSADDPRKSFWRKPPEVPVEISQMLRRRRAQRDVSAELNSVQESRFDGSPEFQLELVGKLIESNPHNNGFWYKRWLLAKCRDREDVELIFTEDIILKNSNSMPAWSYRQWVLKQLEGDEKKAAFRTELKFCDTLLKADIHNEFAWNQRFFVMTTLDLGLGDAEADYAMKAILKEPENEHAWIYLRSLYQEVGFRDGILDNLFKIVFVAIDLLDADEFVGPALNDYEIIVVMNRRKFLYALDTLLCLICCHYRAPAVVCDAIEEIAGPSDKLPFGFIYCVYSILLFVDPVRESYWKWRIEQVRRMKIDWVGWALTHYL